ncbi:MAG: hypothetical protein ACOY3Z_06325 [Thermodesulfobacteriota bacterium]
MPLTVLTEITGIETVGDLRQALFGVSDAEPIGDEFGTPLLLQKLKYKETEEVVWMVTS